MGNINTNEGRQTMNEKTYYVPMRKSPDSGNEIFICGEISLDPFIADEKSLITSREAPLWARDYPVTRIVEIEIIVKN